MNLLKVLFLIAAFCFSAEAHAEKSVTGNVEEYKAPSGGWRIIVNEMQRDEKEGLYEDVVALSPEGKKINIGRYFHRRKIAWLNNEFVEIVEGCGIDCNNTQFFNVNKGMSKWFFDVVAHSVDDNHVAYLNYNSKKNRNEIVISEIYTKKEEPVAVVYRKWSELWSRFLNQESINKAVLLNKDVIQIEYNEKVSDERIKTNIVFRNEPRFIAVKVKAENEDEQKESIEYYSPIGDNDYEKYVYFAGEQPPIINSPKESPLCYKFQVDGLEDQLKKLKDKYGSSVHYEKIVKNSDGSNTLSLKRKDESGRENDYFYFDSPKSCAEHQVKRLGDAPPTPYYDYGGCIGECCTYQTWTVSKTTALRRNHTDSSPVVGTAKNGQAVEALTGVVITSQAGKMQILEKPDDKRLECDLVLRPGDTIYSLYYLGEGYSMIWHRGQLHSCVVGEEKKFRLINDQESEWWAKIMLPDKTIGWTKEIKNFTNVYCNQ